MSVLNRWLSRLQLSTRSQRALTEAALDWRHEVATAETTRAALRAHAIGSAGVVRAVVSAIGNALVEVGGSSWMLRLIAWQALFLLLPHPQWSGWIVQRTFATLPITVAVTILTGPSQRTSPVGGLFGLAILTFSSLTVVSPYPVAKLALAVLILFTALAALLADRVRIDARRGRVTAGVWFSIIAAFFGLTRLTLLSRSQDWPWLNSRALITAYGAAVLLCLWLALVWRQERAGVATQSEVAQ